MILENLIIRDITENDVKADIIKKSEEVKADDLRERLPHWIARLEGDEVTEMVAALMLLRCRNIDWEYIAREVRRWQASQIWPKA